jgi:multiple antibiotic resistance protein
MEAEISEVIKHFIMGFSALLPLVNPIGSALEVMGIVGLEPEETYRSLARKIAISTLLFFVAVGLLGSYLLQFFGISLNVLQVAGGGVVAAIGWSLLNRPDDTHKVFEGTGVVEAAARTRSQSWDSKVFYPLTFPITAGPGCVVVMLTLSAHATGRSFSLAICAHAGLLSAVAFLSILIYICYAYAPRIARRISPSTVSGIVRVIAFIVLCIGVQIAWNGLQPMILSLMQQHHP